MSCPIFSLTLLRVTVPAREVTTRQSVTTSPTRDNATQLRPYIGRATMCLTTSDKFLRGPNLLSNELAEGKGMVV